MRSRLCLVAYLLPQLRQTLHSRPITVRYPFEPLDLPSYFRGRVMIDPQRCTGCGTCVRDCPANGLHIERTFSHTFRMVYYPDRCAYCGQCESSCRFGAICLVNEFVPSTDDCGVLVQVIEIERKTETEDPAQKTSG